MSIATHTYKMVQIWNSCLEVVFDEDCKPNINQLFQVPTIYFQKKILWGLISYKPDKQNYLGTIHYGFYVYLYKPCADCMEHLCNPQK